MATKEKRSTSKRKDRLLLPEWSSCSCNNLCSRHEKRGACPCLAKGSFCTHLCNCGTKKMVCTNRSGNVSSVLVSELGIGRTVDTDSSDEPDLIEDEILLVSFVGEDDNDEHINISSSTLLNRNIQFVAGDAAGDVTSQPLAENVDQQSTTSTDKINQESSTADEEVRTLSRSQLAEFAVSAILLYPDLRAKLPLGDDPQPPDDTSPRWCFCGRCREMPLPEEQLCCRRRTGMCVLHLAVDEFHTSILNRNTLQIAVLNRNDMLVYRDVPSNDNLRHAAYRQYVLFKHGVLGKGNRVVIPSCVVWKVRYTYPSHDGTYTRFKPSRLS